MCAMILALIGSWFLLASMSVNSPLYYLLLVFILLVPMKALKKK
jgi:hypothetical protein